MCDCSSSFTVVEPPNPGFSMSSRRAHRNSAMQSRSHCCYSRAWRATKGPEGCKRVERCLLVASHGGTEPGNNVQLDDIPFSFRMVSSSSMSTWGFPSPSECFSMFLESLRRGISSAQEAFPCKWSKNNYWKRQNLLCTRFLWEITRPLMFLNNVWAHVFVKCVLSSVHS